MTTFVQAGMMTGQFGFAVVSKTASYTVLVADRGTSFHVTGASTITLPAVNTAKDGFALAVSNNGSAFVLVDGNASELINTETVVVLAPGGSIIMVCDGTRWVGTVQHGSSMFVEKVKTVDQPKTEETTLADDSTLVVAALPADTIFRIECWIIVTCVSSVPDIQWSFGRSQTPQASKYQFTITQEDATQLFDVEDSLNTIRNTPLDGTNDKVIKFEGMIHTHPTLTTDFAFRWAQQTTSTAQLIVKLGSWLRLTKLGLA